MWFILKINITCQNSTKLYKCVEWAKDYNKIIEYGLQEVLYSGEVMLD